MVHVYGYSPGASNLCLNEAPGFMTPESKAPVSDAAAWSWAPLLTQVTTEPTVMVASFGVKSQVDAFSLSPSVMLTVLPAASASGAALTNATPPTTAARSARNLGDLFRCSCFMVILLCRTRCVG